MRQEWLLPSQMNEVPESTTQETKDAVEQELYQLEEIIGKIDELRKRGVFGVDAQRRIQGYEEFRRHAVGKVITVETEKKGKISFRVSQANSDFAMTSGNLATPLSPVGYLCRQAYLGFEGKSPAWGTYEVVEVRTLSRFFGQEAEDNILNYKSMERSVFPDLYSTDENMFHVSNLSKSLNHWFSRDHFSDSNQASTDDDNAEIEGGVEFDSFEGFDFFENFESSNELLDEDDDYRSVNAMEDDQIDEYYGLSNYFYLNPTKEQLDVMCSSVSKGPMLIEGVAGSGKTCAALGRAKTLCDAAFGASDQVIESTTFFSQESSVGFVRTGELVQYLKATCLELGLAQLPICEYKELQHNLQQLRDVEQWSSRKSGDQQTSQSKYRYLTSLDYSFDLETTMEWLKLVDGYATQVIAERIIKIASSLRMPESLVLTPQLPYEDASALVDMCKDAYLQSASMLAQHIQSNTSAFGLDKIVLELNTVISRLENQLFDPQSKWISTGKGRWQKVQSRKQALSMLRSVNGTFIRYSKQERIHNFVVSNASDLKNLIRSSDAVKDQFGVTVKEEQSDIAWSKSVGSEVSKSAVPHFSCEQGGKRYAVFIVKEEDIDFYAVTSELFVKVGGQTRPALMSNPFHATLQKNSKAGSAKTTLAKELRRQLKNRLFNNLHFSDLYAAALALAETSGEAVSLPAKRINDKQLADHDIDVILALAHVMSRGANLETVKNLPSRLAEPTYYRSVFVDEVQDFTEIQIFLMGAQAHPDYNAVTMVGDMQQQLLSGKVRNIQSCFPYQTSVDSVLLKENKRQEKQPQLLATSYLFRALVQDDGRMAISNLDEMRQLSRVGGVKKFIDNTFESCDGDVVQVIKKLPRGRTIAIICPTNEMAVELESRLRDVLAAENFRQSYVAERVDLSKKYLVHFSSPQNIKGLEFDTVVLVGMERVDWNSQLDRNSVYVAVSRPRKQLVVVGDKEQVPEHVMDCFAVE
ncbi:TPA: ATP-binding domain-containing protein [Photobacterium damselae]